MSINNIRLLLVAPVAAERANFRKVLGLSGLTAEIIEAVDAASARKVLHEAFDIICVDYHLPGLPGPAFIKELREMDPSTPIVGLVDDHRDEVEQELADAGCTDCMPKGDLNLASRLARRLRFAMRCIRAESNMRKALEQAQQAAASRDDMLAVVSHDLRGPLNSILLALDSLSGDEAILRAMRRTVFRAERLLRDLLDVTRIEAGGMELHATVGDAGRVLALLYEEFQPQVAATGGEIVKEVPAHPVHAKIDPDRLAQAVANLVENAIRHGEKKPITLRLTEAPDAVIITVADHGSGIAPELLPHIFDRFAQGRGRAGSAGLGLTIARGIAIAHGGELTVESAPNSGTQFHLKLPRHKQ